MYNNIHAVYTGYEYGCPHDKMTGNALKETTNICIVNVTLKNRKVFTMLYINIFLVSGKQHFFNVSLLCCVPIDDRKSNFFYTYYNALVPGLRGYLA